MKSSHHYQVGATVTTVSVRADGAGFVVTVGDRDYLVTARLLAPGHLSLRLHGQQNEAHVVTQGQVQLVAMDGNVWRLRPVSGRQRFVVARENISGRVEATMPGEVMALQVEVGESVTQGQPVILLEAMKMELQLAAPCDGQISQIYCQPGQIVDRDEILLEINCNA